MRITVRTVNDYIVDLIIIIESLIIGLAYYFPITSTKYLIFSLVGFSLFLGIINLHIIFQGFPRVSRTQFLFLALIVGSAIYAGIIRHSLPTAIVFISSVTFMLLMYKNGLTKRNISLLLTCTSFLTVFHIISLGVFDENSFKQIMNSTFQNPNMAGIVISSTIMILITGVYIVNKPYKKIIIIILAVTSIYQLYLTENRGSLITILALLLLLMVFRSKSQISKSIRIILLLFPLIFPLLYTGIMSRLPAESEFLGKPLFSGRESEWAYLINYIKETPFSISNLPIGGLNLFLVGVIVFGIVGFTSYYLLLFVIKPSNANDNRLGFKQVAYIAFLCVFIQQTFESTLILGSYGIYIYSYLLLGIACSQEEANSVSQRQL